MSFAETNIYYDDEPAFLSEDPVIYGPKVAELMIRRGWISPNYMIGSTWARSKPVKEEIGRQIANHMLQLPHAERKAAQLTEPATRVVRITIYQGRGRYPDVDNLVGGLKFLIDALKRLQYKQGFKSNDVLKAVTVAETGNGLIWDDAPKYFRLAELYLYRRSKSEKKVWGGISGTDAKAGNYVFVEVFDWPEG